MEKKSGGNSSGITSVNIGILSVVFAIFTPFLGIILGIISLVFSFKQAKVEKNSWSKAGTVLSIIGIVLSILLGVLLATVFAPYLNGLV